ncbi:MAG: TonB-dependent receptor [Novosphingobium sp.]|nr:TonB-dependent receptor [Novosphingobium sp.]
MYSPPLLRIALTPCLAAGLLIAAAGPAHAEASAPDDNNQRSDDIVVSAHALRELGLMAGTIEIEGDELLRASSPQIGDVLAKLPGVSATSFAPGVSRPVLRGLSGDRVLVLIDGIGSLDASSVSADHGVALDTLTVDHIDVLHGPALLAYGGQAIGGAVIVHDKRIPRGMPDGQFDVTALTSFDSVSDGKSAAGSTEFALGSKLVAHVDASWHDANDERVGGKLVSEPLKAELLDRAAAARAVGDGAAANALEQSAQDRNRIANSFAQGSTFGAGLAFIGDGGNVGISVQRVDSRYGIPGRPGSDEQGVSIDMGQTRFDFRGEIELTGFLDTIQLRGGYANYAHDELEEDGAIGTHFARKGFESRLELVQADNGGWRGRSGIQYSWGKLTLDGMEAILPDHTAERFGIFTLQSVKIGPIEVQAAGRLENVVIRAGSAGFDRDFSLAAGAGGFSWQISEPLKLGVSYAHGERAPSSEELLTNGAHIATQAFEIGNRTFARERSDSIEAYLEYRSARTTANLTIYRIDFRGFITPMATGGMNDGLPVFQYRQLPARFQGFEIQASHQIAQWNARIMTLDASADYTHASLKRGMGPVPRIPPLGIQGGLELTAPALTLRGEVEWNAAQRRVAAQEFPTRAFTVVNASVTWRALGEDGPLTLVLAAENIFDVVGRRAASFTRDFVPIAGRNVRLTARVSF